MDFMASTSDGIQTTQSLSTSELIELLSQKTLELLEAMNNRKTDGIKIQELRKEVIQIQEAIRRIKEKRSN